MLVFNLFGLQWTKRRRTESNQFVHFSALTSPLGRQVCVGRVGNMSENIA